MRCALAVLGGSLLLFVAACTTQATCKNIDVRPAIEEAVRAYLEQPANKDVEDPVGGSLNFLLDRPDEQDGGRIVLISYVVGPKNEAGWSGKRVLTLLKLDKAFQVAGGGRVGNLAVQGPEPVSVGWTWLGKPGESPYTFYGSMRVPGVSRVEVTEKDGTVSAAPVEGGCAFVIARRPPPAGEWPPPVPARLRAYDAQGKILYEKRW